MTTKLPVWPVEEWTPPGCTEPISRPVSAMRLAEDLAVAWPWPYTEEQIGSIGRDLPRPTRLAACRAIVQIGRQSAIARTVRAGATPSRPDPRAEIERLRVALEDLSLEAWQVLDLFQFDQAKLLSAIYAVEMSLPEAKAKTARGGAPKSRDAATVAAFRAVYERAFEGGKMPKNGYPAFERACIAPLGFNLLFDSSTRRRQRRTVSE
ncbi:hypothetical protein [Bradyrhizobium japonicum]|uniref:hypothetical protein n=1 Tax=Bradyrhizobium japonicum TaxID=375 RepID=UPI002714966B|nr:hypothetical protein [Bradyrhizobium japonicum]WLB58470.1 hypothetical protein QIH94_21600 [Bradyrhizobium japonicum]WLB59732.1 hypothetical protein QIH96_24735 [Bradyrhizobium japonicum]